MEGDMQRMVIVVVMMRALCAPSCGTDSQVAVANLCPESFRPRHLLTTQTLPGRSDSCLVARQPQMQLVVARARCRDGQRLTGQLANAGKRRIGVQRKRQRGLGVGHGRR